MHRNKGSLIVADNPCEIVAERKLTVNTAWAVLGNLAYVGGRIVIVVLLTRNFESVQVGRILYALAVVTPLSYLINMELRSVFVTDTQGRIKAGHCLMSRLVTNSILLLVLLILCGVQWNNWGPGRSVVILLAWAVRGSESWADVYMGVFQKHEQMKRWAISQAVKTAMVLLWVFIMPIWTDNITWMLVGWLSATVLVAWFYDRVRAEKMVPIRPQWEAKAGRRLIGRGFPLGVFVTLAILNQQVAQYFIEHELGYSAVAYYGVFMMYVSGMATVQNGVNQAILPRLAQYFGKNKLQFLKLLGVVLGVSVLVMLVGLIVVGWQ
ncbi:MAG: oligosaccharide flippase family protein, partial [Sedimentisphaerales bacterium]|nr:oligosaccharide flippase family protein [Sedimentisphaerales bacterium]